MTFAVVGDSGGEGVRDLKTSELSLTGHGPAAHEAPLDDVCKAVYEFFTSAGARPGDVPNVAFVSSDVTNATLGSKV
ncbi:hypothetical protein GCM10022247_44950 [Allokutzneria multivorans]|uniref:Uncharacterized protein n=1 Tax=Allokutzneria multivorans TaxID=1142134 RepID=A0ABP7SVU8_9PSEU